MEQILALPKATCLLLSLAKNAGLSANNSSELAYKGKEFFLTAYQKALKNKTLQINVHKNKFTFPMEEHDSGFHAVGVLTRSPAWEVQLSGREHIRSRKARSQSKNPEAFDRIGASGTLWV